MIDGGRELLLVAGGDVMTRDGIVHREVYREVPPRVEYSLTDVGQSLNDALVPLNAWGERHMEQTGAVFRCTREYH